MTLAEHFTQLSAQQLGTVHALIQKMHPAKNAPRRLRCALYLTIAEQFEAAIHLAQMGLATHSAAHVRAMLESVADMSLLGTDPRHTRRMRYEQVKGEKKFYEQWLTSDGLAAADREMIESRLEKCLKLYEPLHDEFRRPKRTQADSFIDAELDFLIGPYIMLCGLCHSDVGALALRHQPDDHDGMLHRATPPEEVHVMILSLANIAMLHATNQLSSCADFFGDDFDTHFRDMNHRQAILLNARPSDI